MSKHHRFYRPELDVLRCLAFILVFLHHSGLFVGGWLAQARVAGAFGVCLFFFLSAFLITELLDREQESTGTIRLGAFYARRMLRIWPLYFAALLLDFVHLHFTQPGIFSGARLAAFFLLAGNWYVARHGLIGSFSAPLWSISVEEQFYLLWPSARRLLGRAGSIGFSILALVVAYSALWFICHQGIDIETGVWANSFVQFQFFATGALLAIGLRSRTPPIRTWQRPLLAALGLLALFVAQSTFHAKVGMYPALFRWAMPGYLLINAGCILLFLSFLGASSLERARPLVYLGKISYGLYVFHWAVLSVFDKLVKDVVRSHPGFDPFGPLVRVPLAFAATVLCASASYRYFEKPVLRFKQRFEVIRTRPA